VRIRTFRRNVSAVVIAEITVTAQLLLSLPLESREASPVPPQAMESSEAALGPFTPFTIARPATSPQEPVEVNRTVPQVAAPPDRPSFSPIPTDEEISRARVFGEPLVPEEGARDDAENLALAQSLTSYVSGGDSEALEPLEGLVANYPGSRWRVSVQANVGSWYRKKGYFTRAERNLSEAWTRGRDSSTDGVRKLAEFAAGELMTIYMQFGRVDPLEALVQEFEGRSLSGAITETLTAARSSAWTLRNAHEKAIASGAVALGRMHLELHRQAGKSQEGPGASLERAGFQRRPEIDRFPAKHEGASLSEIRELAGSTGLDLEMAKRESQSSPIPLPSVIHLKQGHFAAVVEEREGRYRLDDPILGGEVWMSRQALEEEASGYFLIRAGTLASGWRRAVAGETAGIKGKCMVPITDHGGTRPCDPKTGGCGDSCARSPMAQYAFHLGLANLTVFDTPVGYSPPRGPEVFFKATYNHRDKTQPTIFTYGNLGIRWAFDWLSYIQDDPSDLDEPIELQVRGGGRESYEGFVSGVSQPQQDSRAVIRRTSTDPIVYERELPDGSVEVFSESDHATSPRRVFLKKLRDPQGNEVTFIYDEWLRLTAVQDSIGQVTEIFYEMTADPVKRLRITRVTDPFGRSAGFEYDSAGYLVRITDVIGLQSEFEYGFEDFLLSMRTPYGRTLFRTGFYDTGTANYWLEARDPLGGTERIEQLEANAPLSPTDPPNLVP